MGNRAVITTPQRDLALYLHWNGGRDTIEPVLEYCKIRGYRDPASDSYGWARLCQVFGNFFGGSTCLGIMPYTTDEQMLSAGDDNGIYVIENWEIVDRIYPYDGFTEQNEYNKDLFIIDLNECMPEHDKLPAEFFSAIEVPTETVEVGDKVWMLDNIKNKYELYTVVGIGEDEYRNGHKVNGVPYVDRYDHDGDYSWNCNNYIHTSVIRKAVA